jgi:outer membrane receptor for ferrienterochelin and colicins
MKNIMNKLLFATVCILLLTIQVADAQRLIYGIVTNENDELLLGATVAWKDRSAGAITNDAGEFRVPAKSVPDSLIVTYVGYEPATFAVSPGEDSLWLVIKGVVELQNITVAERGFGNSFSTLDPRNVERINSKELRKAPCCNLSESFETNGAVDITYADALTGVKEIQLLGLRGIYSQFLLENRPTYGGIATPFALEYVPGTWLEGISLAKGASSVRNGYAGIAGQISADLVRPMLDVPVFVNLFTSTEGRGEANLHLNRRSKNGQTAHGLYLHGSLVENKWDMNDDNFYDMPNRHQLNGLYRFQYDGPAGCAQLNIQALTDTRESGQIRTLPGENFRFGVLQNNDRLEVSAKYGKEGVGGKPYQQIGNIVAASWHRTQSNFGPNLYNASQRSLYVQSLFESIIGTTDHKWVVAPNVQYDDIVEQVNEQVLSRRELQPGLMGEYTFGRPNLKLGIPDLVLVAGARGDWNSRFNQWLFTPRVSAKYNFTVDQVLRVSAGRGYRSPNLMAENMSLLASNRRLTFESGMGLESAWNYGINYTTNFSLLKRKSSFSVDIYRTDFTRQILVDVDRSPTEVFFYQIEGASYANSLMAVWQIQALKGLDLKFSYKWQDVRAVYADGVERTIPLIARHRGLVTLDYETPNKKWAFNSHVQITGPQRLPDNSLIPHEYTHDFPLNSPVYALLNAQLTYRHSPKFEVYIGGENLGNFQQHHAIIAANEPRSPYFNGSQMWGPMNGTIGYLGVRITPD